MGTNTFFQSVIVASFSLVAAVLTASLSYYFTKKHQLKMEERRLKEEFYRIFIKALSDVAINNKDVEAQKNIAEGFNTLILIANSKVVKKLMDFHDFIKLSNTDYPRDSDEWIVKHDKLLTDLVKEMRMDLLGKRQGGKHFPSIHLVGNKPSKKQI